MFHELWIESGKIKSMKNIYNKLISILQQITILTIPLLCKPNLIHVSNHYYKWKLKKCGIYSQILPVFSNIAVIPIGGKRLTEGEADTWRFVVFGRIVEE